MGYGIRVFRNDFRLSWRKARYASKLFRSKPAKWPPEFQEIVRQKSPSGVIASYPDDLAKLVAEFVGANQPNSQPEQ